MGEVLGIDVSHHNGKIDWAEVAKTKKFAIMKAQYEAQSHRIDETFEYNYKEAGKNGLARGVYIYIARASVADPVGDAKALLAKLNGRPLEYGIWLDLEDKSIRYLSKDQFTELANAYATIFRGAGYFTGIYCNVDWYNNVLDSKKLEKDFDFWIARYPRKDSGEYDSTSKLKPKYGVAWQYSSKGNVPGINGNVDLNVDYDGVVKLSTVKPSVTHEEKKELYSVGKQYTLQSNMYVRKEPFGEKVSINEIPDLTNVHSDTDLSAIVRRGSKVTCKEVRILDAVWMFTQYGWICAIQATGKKYII